MSTDRTRSREDAAAEVEELIHSLSRIRGLPMAGKGDRGTDGYPVREWLEATLSSPDRMRKGYILTLLMELPGRYRAPLLECIQDEQGYQSFGALAFRARLQNVSGQDLTVQIGQRFIPDLPETSGAAFVTGTSPTGRMHEEWRKVAPGEVLELPATWAANALFSHTMEAHPPPYWGETSAFPGRNSLLEVGYLAIVKGEQIIAPPPDDQITRRGRPPRIEAGV